MVWHFKIDRRRKRLNEFLDTTPDLPQESSIYDYLMTANDIAVNYLAETNTLINNIIQHKDFVPRCSPHSLYTYAAFLNLTEKEKHLRDNVFLCQGIAAVQLKKKLIIDNHMYLEHRKNDKLHTFETVPTNREIGEWTYSTLYRLQKDSKDSFNYVGPTLWRPIAFLESIVD